MKINNFLVGASALLALGVLASCSSEADVQAPTNEEQIGDRYMAIRLINPANTGTRGLANDTPAEFEVGTDKENALDAETTRFYFFTEEGQPFTLAAANVTGDVSYTNMVKPTVINANLNKGDEAGIANAVLVLGKTNPEAPYVGKTPTYVICVANLDNEAAFEALANIDMYDLSLKNVSSDRDQATENWQAKKFKMSNSVYAKETTGNAFSEEYGSAAGSETAMRKVMATKIETSNIASSPTLAQNNPVQIYIERLASKVRVKGLGVYESKEVKNGTTQKAEYDFVTETVDDDNETVQPRTLYVNLLGWRLVNRQSQARLFKNIDATADYFQGWNSPEFHRSYWAVTPGNANYLRSTTYDIYTAANTWFDNYDENSKDVNVAYTLPSTYWQPTGKTDEATGKVITTPLLDRTANSTAIVIKAQVTSDSEGKNPVNFVRWAGQYYDYETFQKVVFNAYEIEQKETNLTYADVHLVKQDGKNLYDVYVGTEFKYNRFVDVQWWNDGMTSYYLNIQHAVKADGTPLFGVVRNHIYENEIEAVVGLGVPGNDRKNPDPEDESYVACRLTVLDWRVISNKITLE